MEFAQEVTEKFLALWDKLGIQKDGWAATTDPRHKRTVQQGSAVTLRKGRVNEGEILRILQRSSGTVSDRQGKK